MIYDIKNRDDAHLATHEATAPPTAIISITDVGSAENWFYSQDWIVDILQMQFNDVGEGHIFCITEAQAERIAQFAVKNYGKVERFLVHCEYGRCRSAGVAAAISKHFEGHSNGIFGNSLYFPNPACYKLVLAKLCKGTVSLFSA